MKKLLLTMAMVSTLAIASFAQTGLDSKSFAKYWRVESESPDYKVTFNDGYCEILAPKGLTMWYRTPMEGDTVIEYDAQVVVEGDQDRLSDLNCFWMASEPAGGDVFKRLKERGGVFKNCSTMQLYYVGYGGNSNTTTRFRRYTGDPDPAILKEYTDPEHLLEPNHWYHIKLVAKGATVQYWRDGELLVDYRDPEPLTSGHFGFRTTLSRTRIKNFTYTCTAPESYPSVPLHWIGATPNEDAPVTFGVPFKKGEVTAKTVLEMRTAAGQKVDADQWTLASWPDGSVKWQAFAAVVPQGEVPSIVKTYPKKPAKAAEQELLVSQEGQAYYVLTGALEAKVPTAGGSQIIESLTIDGVKVGGSADMIVTTTKDEYVSHIDKVTLEQNGAVRATLKLEGTHKSAADGREWLPFVLRMYFYKGSDRIELTHSFVFDGDEYEDFITSMGLRFNVPMREEVYNRHIAFAETDGAVWTESVQPLSGRRTLTLPRPRPEPGQMPPQAAQGQRPGGFQRQPSLEEQQVAGERIPDRDAFDAVGLDLLDNWAQWDEYKLTQLTDNSYTIRKRANDHRPWIGTFTGTRAPGYAFAGDVSGGLGVSLRDFWQLYPTELEVRGARSDEAQLIVWLWSPEAQPMDLRHYDDVAHDLNASYEDVQEGLSTPYGIAKTHELTLIPSGGFPKRAGVAAVAADLCERAQMLPTPQYLHDVHAFGIWSMPDRSNAQRAHIEDVLDQYISLYQAEVEGRHWYGCLDYGDFRHTFDNARDEWMYDVGGFAWDNTELAPNDWLWYMFMRTGRKDIWDMARAMSRHTTEVDVYHMGPLQGLGSRHNVTHWGCGAKEARIGQAAWNRWLLYLTADERSGDLCDESKDSEQILYELDPMRLAAPRSQNPCTAPARLRIGPDWLGYAGNWMTRWERTGEQHYYDMIQAGMTSIAGLPQGFFTGKAKVLGFYPDTGILTFEGDPTEQNTNHLMTIMGGFEIMMEMLEMVDNPAYWDAWTYHAAHYHEFASFRVSRLGGYAAWQYRDPKLAADTWEPLLRSARPGLNTNGAATWSLDAIFMQEVLPLL